MLSLVVDAARRQIYGIVDSMQFLCGQIPIKIRFASPVSWDLMLVGCGVDVPLCAQMDSHTAESGGSAS